MTFDGRKKRAEVALKLASREQVLDVLAYWAAHGCSLKQALARKHIPAEAFWARSGKHEPEVDTMWAALKGQWAFAAMDDVYDQASAFAAAGNVGALSVRAKQAGAMAKAMDQNVWGDKVQVDSRQLVVISNLFDDPELVEGGRGFMSVEDARVAGLISDERAKEFVKDREVRELAVGSVTLDCGAVAQTEAENEPEMIGAEPTSEQIEAIWRAQGGRPIPRS